MATEAPPSAEQDIQKTTNQTATTGEQQQSPQTNPENDPNLLLQSMIARRATRKTAKPPAEGKETEQEGEKTEDSKPESDKKQDQTAVSAALSKALGFRQKPAQQSKKEEEKASGDESEATEDAKADENEPEAPAKTIVSKKKPAAPVVDPVRIASEAAAAATKEAIKGIQSNQRQQKQDAPQPEDALTEEDRHEFEVARYMASKSAKFKNADKVILEHVRKANEYAARWEQANQGKIFNPEDDEHDSFYESLRKPWADHEFRSAETEMVAERVAERASKKADEKLVEIERKTASLELTPIIERANVSAASTLAKAVGEGVYDSIVKNGFEKFAEDDPITAQELDRSLSQVQPMIETMIQIDDPKGRIAFDQNNPMHVEWLRFLEQKESEYAGVKDNSGRMFATRIDYTKMSQQQRARHWFLTVDHLVSEVVSDTAKTASERINSEKERVRKMAERMGYIQPQQKLDQKKRIEKSQAEEQQEQKKTATTADKPASPSASSGVAIDNKETSGKHGIPGLASSLSEILFRR